MKRLIVSFIIYLFFAFSAICASDHVILRNGQEIDVCLYQINDELVVYSYNSRDNAQRHELPISDVYMMYIHGQGNVYINTEGQRVTGESKRVNPTKSDVIYLVEGREISADNIRITPTHVIYDIKRQNIGGISGVISKPRVIEEKLDKTQVFMIRYRNGLRDIITPFDVVEIDIPKIGAEPEFVVVFHEVQAGETLDDIARKYTVNTEEIVEWNDIPKSQKKNVPLKIGMQLLIYQPK